ncbi:T9SS type B sorting domain-containing protein [Flavobacterium urocaniciphilum]|uniref:Gliding motility-associated C-terminal domain-containing protein n=1 Tax=Flavobacterium urocaniciphilum TaxID=1299341 RepID=A0A1H9BKA1_9FLAO|nr:T9SS type B sorting domain-containing protein [Flavobacterium urocaniciphilum]SEP89131.1 gliding motility-associated C-terminal domain-containing protein [Flavobacterium urocaniciphilum]
MKKILYILMLCASVSFSQTITVDNTTNSPTDLVNLLLGNSCVAVSNISISSNQSVGYFNNNGSSFPINQGIILRSGNILNTQGLYTDTNLSTTASGGGTDAFLQNLSNTSSGTSTALTDLSYIQFDFIPISSSFSFDFLFASNEYGQFQCLSNDIFAFELTNLGTGVTTNLGVIPGTSNPVTVKNIKNSLYNNTCSSTNPSLFGVYNVSNPAASTLNMRGHTVVLNASSAVVPNTSYRLKLVIADYGDSDFDSAVFISGGSFTNTLNLGADQTICAGNTAVLDTQLDNTYTYQWYQNGNPVGGNTSTYTINGPGTYTVEVTKGSCYLTDTIVFNDLSVTNPINLQTCNTGAPNYTFDLTTNNETQLGIDNSTYDVFYYASPADAAANIPIASPNNFSTVAGQTIYVKIFNTVTNQFCDAVYQFDLIISATVNATQPADVELCETAGSTFYFLANLDSDVLNGQSGYTVLYYTFQADAIAGNGATITNVDLPNGTSTVTVWIRMQDSTNPSCFDVTSVDIIVHPLPIVDDIADVVECSSYVLPVITNGNYFTGPNGTGTQLNAGDTIDITNTYFIFIGPDANGCTNESSFNAYFVDEYEPTLDNCGSFTIPNPPYNIGAFYTAPGGPTGTGTLIPVGTTYTNTTQTSIVQTVYFYAEVNNVFCRDEQFDINIHPIPLADDPVDVTYCNSYVLPSLTNGFYYSGSGATGTQYFAGDAITTSQTVYVYNSNTFTDVNGNPGFCVIENPFQVNIVDTTVFTSISSCVSYDLPPISFGGYFTAPMGGGTQLDPTIPITTSQVVYYYANTSLLPNCTDNLNYNITINPLPAVDTIPSGTHCGEFILPTLTNGSYFMYSGGPSAIGQVPLSASQIIDLTGNNLAPGTYYIYAGPDANSCVQESSFTISITPLPIVDEYINQVLCNPYSIPAPTVGQIYTDAGGPTGTGVLVSPTDVFNADQRFYLYYQDPGTGCIVDKPFEMYYNGINLPDYPNVNVCDSYTLPVLTHVPPEPTTNYTIGYFYNNDGTNPVPNGTVFTPLTANPISVFVYAVNNGRFGVSCVEVDEIVITVSETPNLSTLALVFDPEECGTYVLPSLPPVPYTIGYFSQPNGVGPITDLSIENTGTTSQNYTYYVYATATNNANCNDEQAFSFTVHPLLNFPINDGLICVDPITNIAFDSYTVNTGLNPAQYTVNWYLNGTLVSTGPSYSATAAGTYTVEFIKLFPDVGANCNYNTSTFNVVASSPAVANFTVSAEFDSNTTFITVNITDGLGNYLYQLEYPDGSTTAFQSSNTFTDLESGEYFVNIYDMLGNCSPTRVGPIYIVNYPKFFTPNGDGVNDYWNIYNLSFSNDAIISIFDRYGKLIKQITPSSIGWDGKYNGKDLPSTDYWFSVEYTSQSNNKAIFKSHFTLKR